MWRITGEWETCFSLSFLLLHYWFPPKLPAVKNSSCLLFHSKQRVCASAASVRNQTFRKGTRAICRHVYSHVCSYVQIILPSLVMAYSKRLNRKDNPGSHCNYCCPVDLLLYSAGSHTLCVWRVPAGRVIMVYQLKNNNPVHSVFINYYIYA